MANESLRYYVSCSRLPLAVYREVAAHLRQVEGVDVELICQKSQRFDYNQSQVEGLWIHHADDSDAVSRERVNQILTHYNLLIT
ncbi:MAG: hypothetical protein RIM23_20170 [Coleofasciculus sp. G3-WIS-01]|uniref:hypothetical protein n=1 Tax=Coleofasciculus sp. G3-WIS-01 TaxID=3069528 RepID=UPI0032FB2AF1